MSIRLFCLSSVPSTLPILSISNILLNYLQPASLVSSTANRISTDLDLQNSQSKMKSSSTLSLLCLASIIASSWSFSMQPKPKFQARLAPLKDLSSFSTLLDASEGAKGAVESYVNLFIPMFKQAQEAGLAPDVAIKWGHGAAMATVLFAMGGIGTFLGWQIRLGGGSNTYAFTLGKTAREQHPLIMGLAFFFFLLGGQGGKSFSHC